MAQLPPHAPVTAPATWRRRLLLLGVSCTLSLALAEVALRLAWTNPYATEAPELLLPLRLQHATADQRFGRHEIAPQDPVVRFRTDARGYILPSRRFSPPDFTVAFVGGSTTECSAVREDARFHAVVSTLLEKRGLKVDALNAGRSGNTIHDGLNNLVNHIADDRPDVVVVMHVANDAGLLAKGIGYARHAGVQPGVRAGARGLLQEVSAQSALVGLVRRVTTVSQAVRNLAKFDERVVGADGKAADPGPYEARLRAFVRVCKAFGIVPVVVTEPLASIRNALTPDWAHPHTSEIFNHVAREVARTEQAVLVDLARHLAQDVPDWNKPMAVFYDGMHVTDAGSLVYARFLAARLEQDVLRPLQQRRAAATRAGP